MDTTTKITGRRFDGTITGTLGEGGGLRVRLSAQLVLERDTDGAWLAYCDLGPSLDDVSAPLSITDAAACRAFDALSELIADPVGFGGAKIVAPGTT